MDILGIPPTNACRGVYLKTILHTWIFKIISASPPFLSWLLPAMAVETGAEYQVLEVTLISEKYCFRTPMSFV